MLVYNNITINNDTVIVDGKIVESGLSGIVKVEFIGNLANLECKNGNIDIGGHWHPAWLDSSGTLQKSSLIYTDQEIEKQYIRQKKLERVSKNNK